MKRFFEQRGIVYVIVDKGYLGKRDPVLLAEKVLSGKPDIIQYRDKVSNASEILYNAIEISKLAKKKKIPFIVNDRVDIALLSNADGVHIGIDDVPPVYVRKILGPKKLIGYSTHSVSEACRASKLNVDYISIGPLFYSRTKTVCNPLGIEVLGRIKKRISKPLIAIGGIGIDNGSDVINSGADGISVISCVCGSKAPGEKVIKLRKSLSR